jgi:hypothetical protein
VRDDVTRAVQQHARTYLDRYLPAVTRTWRIVRVAVLVVPGVLIWQILTAIISRTAAVPFWDEWETVDLFGHLQAGTLQFADFWAFHNEHRIVIPQIATILLIALTHWNRQVEMIVDLGFAVIETALLAAALWATVKSKTALYLLLVPLSLLALSLGQYENWLHPFQITFILTTLGAALCAWAITAPSLTWPRLVLALAGATLAALSSLGGTAAFVAFLLPVLRAGWRKVAVWIIVAASVLIPYFHGFPHTVPLKPSLLAVEFFFVYLAAPTGTSMITPAVIVGIASLVIALANVIYFWLRQRTLSGLDVWVSLGLFALAVAAMTAIGRVAITDVAYAGSSRYQAFSALWWIALLGLTTTTMVATASASRSASPMSDAWFGLAAINVSACAVLTLVLVFVNQSRLETLQNVEYGRLQTQQCVAQYATATPVCLEIYYPNAYRLQTKAALLRQWHMNIFYQDGASTQPEAAPSVVPLTQHVNPATNQAWVTTNYDVDQSTGYIAATTLGYVYAHAVPQTEAVYGCVDGAHQHFISLDQRCGGQSMVRVEGWIYPQQPAQLPSVPLFRCSADASVVVTSHPACQGVVLGWILQAP